MTTLGILFIFLLHYWLCVKLVQCLRSVVKEEIVDDDAHLPCFNGRVISWVSYYIVLFNRMC